MSTPKSPPNGSAPTSTKIEASSSASGVIRRLFLFLAMLVAVPAVAQPAPRQNAIQPELLLESRAVPGGEAELAILMRTRPGWHGYWLNPGDAGLPMSVEWTLPPGWSVGPMRYPVPVKLLVAGIVNHVFEEDYAVLLRLKAPPGITGSHTISAKLRWLACTDKVCVPEQGDVSLSVPTGGMAAPDPRFNEWRRALPRPLSTPANFELSGDTLRLAIPLPASAAIGEPYFFPAEDGPVDYAAPQAFTRKGDLLIAELKRRRGAPGAVSGVLAFGDGRGLELRAEPGPVPDSSVGLNALLLALLGALAGGILLNLMPCVFPILALKALHLARSGGDEGTARRDALGYAAGAIVGTGALGIILLAIRAGGNAAGWAFQLQDPRTILLLALLATAITLNLLRVFELPVIGGERNPTGSFGTGALAAFVATPCAGPFLGAALGTALLLPAPGSIAVFAMLGLGLALPFVTVAFVPALRSKLPRPGPWMIKLQRILAIPMALTAAACLWLLWRQGGTGGLLAGIVSVSLLVAAAILAGGNQRRGTPAAALVVILLLIAAVVPITGLGRGELGVVGQPAPGTEAWSDEAVAQAQATGKPVFVYFTADWCLTCKVNEAGAIDRDSVQTAFKKAGVVTLVGDWTNGDPAITRLLESRGRAGVPLYLWYQPGRSEPEELPQVLTAGMLSERAGRPS
jgi:DsbC/DsbD-like thiol-disulfide interchange protein/cytochrome c biogenesis protein CcdA